MKLQGQQLFFTLVLIISFSALSQAASAADGDSATQVGPSDPGGSYIESLDFVLEDSGTPVGPSSPTLDGAIPVVDTQPSYLPQPGPDKPAAANTPDIPLGTTGFNFDEPLVRVDPTNRLNVTVTSHNRILPSVDGGATFPTVVNYPVTLGGSNGDTAMAYDSQGRLFWANLVNANDGDLQIMRTNPLTGASLTVPVNVQVVSGDPLNNGFDDKEFLAADEYPASAYTDNLYMIWTKFGASTDISYSRSTNQGAGWSLPVTFSVPAEGFPWPSDIAVAPNGDVYAAYHSGGDGGAVGDTWVLRSSDGGATFPQKNQAFTPGQSDVTFNVQSAAGAIPLTQFWMQGSVQPWVLPDPARPGNVYVVNNDDPDNTHASGDDADVVIARSTNNGVNWTVTTIPDGSGGAHQVFPFAAIDQLGNIAVAWYDTRRGQTNGFGRLLLDVFATYSTDGGVTWATAFMVNDPNNPFDPDFPNNQRRWPTPQITPCAKASPSTETCRIGEYFGIDIHRGAAYVTWVGNTFDMGGAVTGDQQWIDSFLLPADLSISKSDSPDAVNAGENLTYTIQVDNAGPADAINVVVTDTLPAGVTYVSSTDSCVQGPVGTLTCTLGVVPAADNASFNITVTVDPGISSGVTLTNNVSVSADNDDPDSDDTSTSEDTLVAREVDIIMSKTESIETVVAGSGAGNLVYQVTATNNGPSDVTGAQFTEVLTLPAGVTVVGTPAVSTGSVGGSSPNYSWTGVNIPAGSFATMTVTLTVSLAAPEGTDIVGDTATFTGSTGGENIVNSGDDIVTEATSIRWPRATFNVYKEYTEGGAGAVTVTLTCTGGSYLQYNPQVGVTTAALVVERYDIDLVTTSGTSCTVTEAVPPGYYEYARTAECDVNPTEDRGGDGDLDYECTITNAPTRATFNVAKRYSDGNPTPVEISISCNTGLPLEQSKFIDPEDTPPPPDNSVDFVVVDFTEKTLDCVITETPLPGYETQYTNRSAAQIETDGCYYDDVEGDGDHSCFIFNDLLPVTVTVDKVWVDENPGYLLPDEVKITLFCDSPIGGLGDPDAGAGVLVYNSSSAYIDPFNPGVFWLLPDWDGTRCHVTEKERGGFIGDVSDCDELYVEPGLDDSCTVINTRLYEGIPTLSQYGLAILALLMLAIGAVSFRRFA